MFRSEREQILALYRLLNWILYGVQGQLVSRITEEKGSGKRRNTEVKL
jgi:hypothetical protein